jgi:type III secretory pathway component EscT
MIKSSKMGNLYSFLVVVAFMAVGPSLMIINKDILDSVGFRV